jgi:mRNA interferase MazF
MNPRQGDIVLVPVPFTDLSSHKRRPVVILSSDVYNDASPDFIVVAMTSTPVQTRWSLPITDSDLRAGRLNRPGTVRADKIYTLSQSLAVSRFGAVNDDMFGRIREKLLDALGAGLGRREA